MPTSENIVGGQRFEMDLRRIREAKNISIDELSRKTHITPDVLIQFEESGLINHPRFNNVYLRALVKTYAEALRVPVDGAVQALEDTLAGNYTGHLSKYIGAKDTKTNAPSPKVEAPKAEKVTPVEVKSPIAPAKVEPLPTVSKAKPKGGKSLELLDVEVTPTKQHESLSVDKKDKSEAPDKADNDKAEKDKSEKDKKSLEDTIDAFMSESPKAEVASAVGKDIDPELDTDTEMVIVKAETVKEASKNISADKSADKSDKASSKKDTAKKNVDSESRSTPKPASFTYDATQRSSVTSSLPPLPVEWEPESRFNFSIKTILMAVCALIIVGGGIWLLGDMSGWWQSSPAPAPTTENQGGAANGATSGGSSPAPKAIALPDSIKFTITATNGTVSPAYVTKDDAVKAMQKWIEKGDSTIVYAKQKVKIDSKSIKNMTLKVQGKPWSIAGQDTLKSLTLTRETIQQTLK